MGKLAGFQGKHSQIPAHKQSNLTCKHHLHGFNMLLNRHTRTLYYGQNLDAAP